MTIEFGQLRPEEHERHWQLGQRAFGTRGAYNADRPMSPDDQVLVARENGELVATTAWCEMGQFFGGRRVPCGGISSVMVEPEARGGGLARELMVLSLAEMVDRGLMMSTLYPTTTRLYRSVGYEMAGMWARSRVGLDELPRDAPGDGETFERGDWDDPDLRTVYSSMARRHDGWIDRPDVMWGRFAHDTQTSKRPSWISRLRRDGETVGWIAYDYGESDARLYSIDVRHVFALDTAALRRLLALVASGSTAADSATFFLPVPLLGLCVEHAHRIERVADWMWMARLLDAPAAVAARGWPPGLDAAVALRLRDPRIAANDGTWMLSVEDGEAALEPVADGRPDALEMGIGTFSALFTGWADPFVLAASGAVSGETERRLASLQACFAGPQPTLVDFF